MLKKLIATVALGIMLGSAVPAYGAGLPRGGTGNGAGGSGDVVGPAGATAEAVLCWDGATGKLVKDCTGALMTSDLDLNSNDLTDSGDNDVALVATSVTISTTGASITFKELGATDLMLFINELSQDTDDDGDIQLQFVGNNVNGGEIQFMNEVGTFTGTLGMQSTDFRLQAAGVELELIGVGILLQSGAGNLDIVGSDITVHNGDGDATDDWTLTTGTSWEWNIDDTGGNESILTATYAHWAHVSNAAPTDPVACTAGTLGTTTYISDTDDASAGEQCTCHTTDDESTFDWRTTGDLTAACTLI